jgi:ribonucleoside-diphosphate reductase alpha chain
MRGAMIETIVKRDGRKEDFSPNKINKWGEWASKSLGNRVDWSSVVLHTVSTLSKETTSLLLQERLIKTCLEYNSWSYNRMAGRLYAALIYKKVFNGTIPTVKEVHRNLQKIGLMEYLDYSDE